MERITETRVGEAIVTMLESVGPSLRLRTETVAVYDQVCVLGVTRTQTATNNSAVITVLFRSVGHWGKNATHVGRRRKFREVSCTECRGQENDFELAPTVKMANRHPLDGSFGSEFTAICNHCRVIATGSLKTPKSP